MWSPDTAMPGTAGKAGGIGAVIIRFVAVQKSVQKAGLGVIIMVRYMIPDTILWFGLRTFHAAKL